MRWPIHIQLLLPTLSVVVLAITLASAAMAYFGARRASRQEEENLRRVVATLTEATFPLTERVLVQMRGLSGAEFVLLDEQGRSQAATLPVGQQELHSIRSITPNARLEDLAASPTVTIGGRTYRACRVPVAPSRFAVEAGSLVVLYREDLAAEAVRQAVLPAAVAGVVAAAAAVLVTTILARRFVRPIQRLGDETARLAGGVFLPVPVPERNDEIRDLTVSINQMAEKLGQYEADVRRNERLRTLGQLGAGIAHQLRNAATGARMAIELHERECPQGADGEALGVALRQLRLMESYLHRFLRLGRAEPTPHERVDLESLAGDVLELVRPACEHAKIALTFHRCPEPLAVWGEGESLRDLLMNLVLNGVEAARRRADGTPQVVVELGKSGDEKALMLVKDSGSGPDAAESQRLFEPFVSGKPEGAGLGLYVARQIAEAHRGTIAWQRLDNMTCFAVELPLMKS
jgi:signal transduction histidine kinase